MTPREQHAEICLIPSLLDLGSCRSRRYGLRLGPLVPLASEKTSVRLSLVMRGLILPRIRRRLSGLERTIIGRLLIVRVIVVKTSM